MLKDEGYIDAFDLKGDSGKNELEIALKYYAGRPVIERIERVSRPGLRIYRGRDAIPQVMNGLVVEYKGEGYKTSDDSVEKRAIGEYWARLTGNLFLFAVERDAAGRGVAQQLAEVVSHG